MASAPTGRPRDPDIDHRIVHATRALLHEGGLDAVTISAVASCASVSRPAVYRRYADRDALALAVLLDDLDRVAVQHAPTVPRDLPILDQLVALTHPIFAYYAERPELTSALIRATMFSGSTGGGELESQLFGFLQDIALRFAGATERGELRADVDVGTLVASFFSLYFGCVLSLVRGGEDHDVDTLTGLFAAMMRQHLDGARP